MRAYTSSQFVLPLPEGHRFPMEKYRLLRDRVAADLPDVALTEAPAADDAALVRVHTRAYIDAVAHGTLTAAEQRAIGFPWSPAMAERARRSVGATVAAAETALHDGVAVNLAGGTHHAHADRGGGFCVFNDVAVAIRALQAASDHPLTAVVIDLDVHQGDGTAAIFAGDPSVVTLSLHGEKNYPFAKVASDIDVPLPDGCADDAYLDALDAGLAALWRTCADTPPAIAFYLAGADPHEGDRLGRLKLTTAGLAERDRRVFAALTERLVPTVMVMAGGYGRSMDDTLEVQMGSLRAAVGSWERWRRGAADNVPVRRSSATGD